MELLIRAFLVYLVVLVIFRATGKRMLSQLTVFDFILLFIISEATQKAITLNDNSLTGLIIVVVTLVCMNVTIAYLAKKFRLFDKITNGVPIIVIDEGELREESLKKANIGVDDILESARQNQGLENLDQIKYAVLEKDGQISIIPNI